MRYFLKLLSKQSRFLPFALWKKLVKLTLQKGLVFLKMSIDGNYVLFLFDFFYVWPSYFWRLFKVIHVIGWTNHDISLCSDLVMSLSDYIHRAYGKKFSTLVGIEPRTSRSWVICLNWSTVALLVLFWVNFTNK